MGFPGTSGGKESACNVGDWVQSLGWEDLLEKRKATHSSILAWRIEYHGLQSMGCEEFDMTESLSLSLYIIMLARIPKP